MRSLTRPLTRKYDFYDTGGRLHGVIVLLPILYGTVQTSQGQTLEPWFWWMVLATLGFAIFARRPARVQLNPTGIRFPEQKSPEYPWDQMCEAHARADALEILLSDGQRIAIEYKPLRRCDIERIKHLVKSQFKLMADRSAASPSV
jgi:hypothetical protein